MPTRADERSRKVRLGKSGHELLALFRLENVQPPFVRVPSLLHGPLHPLPLQPLQLLLLLLAETKLEYIVRLRGP
jgi:hypothetical protein